MVEALGAVLTLPGFWLIMTMAVIAGAVYGFAGFGAALIFMPVAVRLLPVEMAVAGFNIAAIGSAFTVLPDALRQVERRGLTQMILAAVPTAAIGVWVLRTADVDLLRWAVILITLLTLVALVMGWRYRTVPAVRTRVAVGAATGLVGGATGLLGPIMVLFQLAGGDSAARNRATTLAFLTITSVLLLPLMAIGGVLTRNTIILGFLMFLPYAGGTLLGQALFNPAREGVYRVVAYTIIFAAILIGLPVWG